MRFRGAFVGVGGRLEGRGGFRVVDMAVRGVMGIGSFISFWDVFRFYSVFLLFRFFFSNLS